MPLWKGNDLISGPVVHQHVGSTKKGASAHTDSISNNAKLFEYY